MVRNHHDDGLPCATSCREEILAKIGRCIDVASLWKFAGIMVSIVTTVIILSITVHSSGQDARDTAAKNNYEQIQKNTIAIAEIKKDLEFIKNGQEEIKKTSDLHFDSLLKEIKKK